MIKSIINTFLSKIIIAVLSFAIISINSKVLGAEGLGEISLIILAIAIFLLLIDMLGGSVIIYLLPKTSFKKLFCISYLWIIIISFIYFFVVKYLKMTSEQYVLHTILISVLMAFSTTNQMFLVARKRITSYNYLQITNSIIILISILFLYYTLNYKYVIGFLYALYLSNCLIFIISFIYISSYFKEKNKSDWKYLIRQLLKLGSFTVLSNLVTKLNYRLTYYFINIYKNIGALGHLSLAVQISESTLIVPRSVSLVQYSEIANMNNKQKASFHTLFFTKIIFAIMFLILFTLVMIPEKIFFLIFSPEFINLKQLLLLLSPGILFLSLTIIYSHYFSGLGKMRINMYASLIGLFITLICAIIFIPELGIIGAAITISSSYFSVFLFNLFAFLMISETKNHFFTLSALEIRYFKLILYQSLKNNKHVNQFIK